MFTATLFRQNWTPILRRALYTRPLSTALFASRATRATTSPPCLRATTTPPHRLRASLSKRWESAAARQARHPPAPQYPELLSLYLAPFAQTALLGIFRAGTLVILLLGTLVAVPAYYLDASTPNWTIPLVLVFSAAPFLVAAAFGPTVANISVYLPASARRSRERLMVFANDVPPNTRVRVQFIRFAPWLTTYNLFFADLRRLPPAGLRLSNLEHIPLANQGRAAEKGLWGWMARMYFGRYWVNMASSGRDPSRVPGAWETMWRQIPWKGAEGESGKRVERKAVAPSSMLNRPIVRPREGIRSGRR
ncbi:hypothetical protein B0A55_05922 [Friedmanniomyces simplex]|uniref:Uncharacterized protein n=1 Tax=Friedmanniomyces simplex TaxID=329884 RepID=A0A4U0XI19_9PEZI|nr:hypothetical protein B0A55_05922 [Friedmanniomyces simplex]